MRRAADLVPTLLAATIVLGGCTAPAPERPYDPEAAERLQSVVLAATAAAHEREYAEAAAHLDELESAASAAFARGEITEARFEAIMIAIGLVRADLEAALAAAAEQSREPAAAQEPESSGTAGSATSATDDADTGATDDSTTAPGNGRGNPGGPGPPEDRGKRD